jgi:hypothetical protein
VLGAAAALVAADAVDGFDDGIARAAGVDRLRGGRGTCLRALDRDVAAAGSARGVADR